MLTDLGHARHRQTGADPIFGELTQCRHVVRQNHSLLICRPCEQVRIINPGQTNVLDEDQIECGSLTEQPAGNRAINLTSSRYEQKAQ